MGSGASGIYEGASEYRRGAEEQRASAMDGLDVKKSVEHTDGVHATEPSGLARNSVAVKEKFHLHEDGYFADRGSKGHNRVFSTEDPVGDSRELYSKLSEGGVESEIPGGKGVRAKLDDGAWVNYRVSTKTPESPAVQISDSPTELVKNQKVHFRERGER
ncbi:MAG: hypothetical protein IJ111_02665 [Eggerthellaceae bacterium]|nr:hypothetical protein [Eggerthellaceae bacterium]